LLWDLANDMEPEDSCLWALGTADQQTIVFTQRSLEYLQGLLAEHKPGAKRRHPTSST
jgi:hypothetical protein